MYPIEKTIIFLPKISQIIGNSFLRFVMKRNNSSSSQQFILHASFVKRLIIENKYWNILWIYIFVFNYDKCA